VDDTVLDKPYSQEGKTDLVGYFWSGKHGRAVKGINLVTLLYSDGRGVRVPVNWRAVDKAEKKTKNELFREMLEEVLAWGLRPAWVSADAWYSSLENLKFLRKHELGFLVGLEKNRTLSEREHEYRRVEEVAVPERGRVLHLRGFGFVSVFRTVDKNNDLRHYAAFEPAPKKSLVKSSPSAASSGCTPSTGAWNATTALLNKSAMPSTSSCAGSEPSLTTSSARCAPSSISNKPSGVENS
jgi:DDE superfamily endonuclease